MWQVNIHTTRCEPKRKSQLVQQNIKPQEKKSLKVIKFYVSKAAEISSVPNLHKLTLHRCTDRMFQLHKVFVQI